VLALSGFPTDGDPAARFATLLPTNDKKLAVVTQNARTEIQTSQSEHWLPLLSLSLSRALGHASAFLHIQIFEGRRMSAHEETGHVQQVVGSGRGICQRGFLVMEREALQPNYEDGFIDVAGARVHYLHAGYGKPIVLIHGLIGSSDNWRSNIDALAENGSVYAIDLVNMGKSQRVTGVDAGLVATANRIVSVMDALGLDAADIIAHSHGGAIALMLAALHPARVRRLILFAPANPFCRSCEFMVRFYSTRLGRLLAWMLPYLPSPIQRVALGAMYGGPERVVDRCLREIVIGLRNPDTLRHVLSVIRCWCAEMTKLKAAIRRVKRTPVLLVWGDRDCTVSLSSAMELKRKLHASQLVVLADCGHSVFEEKPEESNRIMSEWLSHRSLSAPHRHKQEAPSIALRPSRTASLQHLSHGTLNQEIAGGDLTSL
jgi:pimeloyl-ACP methyl ester carboxylesterase